MDEGPRPSRGSITASEWRQIVDSAAETAIITTDLAGAVTSWSEGARRILGWTEEEMLGHSLERLFDDPAVLRREQEDAVAHGKGGGQEGWRRRKDGSRIWAIGELSPIRDEAGETTGFVKVLRDRTAQRAAEEVIAEDRRTLQILNRAASALAVEQDLQRLVQIVTDAGVELSGAEFGAFFYNVLNDQGESYMLYTLSGVPAEAFSKFPQPRNTQVFGPTFRGEGIVRSDDITKDPRYGKNAPRHGMPEGHLPVRSYLAVPVISRSGQVIGGLFFAHATPGVFTERSERGMEGLAAEAAVAIDNVRLAQAAEQELAERRRAEDALRESNARLELATRAASLGIWDWDLETDQIIFSDRARALWGFPASGSVTREMMADAIHPDDAPETQARFARATDPLVRDTSVYEYRVRRPDGAIAWIRAHAEAVFEARDGETRAIRYIGTMEDITSAKTGEAALQASEARLRLALDAGRMAVWAVDASGAVKVTPEFNRLLRLAEDAQPTLKELQGRYYPGELERVQQIAADTMLRGERYFEFEYRHMWPNGEARWLLVRAEFLHNLAGEVSGAIGVVMDVTDRRESEERLKLLAREVDHRANNLLTVVQGVIALSRADDPEALKATITGRVQALAHAHKLLSTARWEGADLLSLAKEELSPFDPADEARVSLNGEPVSLAPAEAQAVAMLLHELATNAAKYGGLSTPTGRVELVWNVSENGALDLVWRESGGPSLKQPSRRGFGLTIIERALSTLPGSSSQISWKPAGLVCEVRIRGGEKAAARLILPRKSGRG